MSQTDLPGLTTLAQRDPWQERGESNNKLYRSRLGTPLRPHTCTYTLLLCWINGSSCVKDIIVQRGAQTHLYTHKHMYCGEMKWVLHNREGDKGQGEQNVSSDLNSLIWHPAICHSSMEQMFTLWHANLNTVRCTHLWQCIEKECQVAGSVSDWYQYFVEWFKQRIGWSKENCCYL